MGDPEFGVIGDLIVPRWGPQSWGICDFALNCHLFRRFLLQISSYCSLRYWILMILSYLEPCHNANNNFGSGYEFVDKVAFKNSH